MFTQIYFPLEGQTLLILDAVLLLFILVSEDIYIPTKRPFSCHAIFGLCWSVIVVASAVVQRLP
jgi:hypothetical protein